MRVAVIVRTLNESKNIERFCESYIRMFDGVRILVADGGSTDDTISKLRKFGANVEARKFKKKINIAGHIINPRGRHINYLIDWAMGRHPDWIIFDDVDCVPTKELQKVGAEILKDYRSDMVFAYRMFMLGNDKWFPDMNRAGQSLWAWKSTVPVRASENDPLVFTMKIPTDRQSTRLDYPYSLLHYFYPDIETFQRKKAQYVATGEVPEYYDPMLQFGRIEEAPAWATYQ